MFSNLMDFFRCVYEIYFLSQYFLVWIFRTFFSHIVWIKWNKFFVCLFYLIFFSHVFMLSKICFGKINHLLMFLFWRKNIFNFRLFLSFFGVFFLQSSFSYHKVQSVIMSCRDNSLFYNFPFEFRASFKNYWVNPFQTQ